MDRQTKLKTLNQQIINCQKCRLSKTRKNAVPGEGKLNSKLFFIGQAPGREEDKTGKPFVGRAGKFLDKLLLIAGIDRKKAFITSCVKCFPPGNRTPKKEELSACKPYLKEQIKLINPEVVVLMGKIAQAYSEEDFLKGKKIIKTYHPSAGMRFPRIKKRMIKDFKKLNLFNHFFLIHSLNHLKH